MPGSAARTAWRDAGLLTLAALVVRVIVATAAVALTKDGTIYARAAQAAAAGDAVGWLLPTYPPLTSACVAPFLALGLPVEPWAGIAIALVSAPVAALAYALGRDGWGRRAGWLAGAFAAVTPALARAGGTLLATGPHATLILLAVWCGTRALRAGASLGWGWGAGVAAGLAYDARPEGLGAALVVGTALALALWRPAPGRTRGRLGGQLALGAAGLWAAMWPLVVHAGTVWGDPAISRKKRVVAVFAAERIGLDLQAGGGWGHLLGRVPVAVWEALRDSATGWHLLLVAFGLVGFALGRRVAAGDDRRAVRRLCWWTAAAWGGLGCVLKFSLGYLAESHVVPVGLALLPWSAVGVLWCADRLAAWRPALTRWAVPGLTALVCLVLAAKSLVPLQGRRRSEVAMGRRLAGLLPADPLIVSNLPRVSWYAGARARFIPIRFAPRTDAAHELAFVRGLGAAALVFDAHDVAAGLGGAAPTHPGLLPATEGEAAEPLLRTPPETGDDYRAVRIRPAQ